MEIQNDRYQSLLNEFQLVLLIPDYKEFKHSLNKIFSYIYHYTEIKNIEDIDEETLINYIEFQCYKKEKENYFVEAIKDVKRFNTFLINIKKIDSIPKVDLSINKLVNRMTSWSGELEQAYSK